LILLVAVPAIGAILRRILGNVGGSVVAPASSAVRRGFRRFVADRRDRGDPSRSS